MTEPELALERPPGPPAPRPTPWPEALRRWWRPALLVLAGHAFLLSAIWQLTRLGMTYGLILRPSDGGERTLWAPQRALVVKLLLVALVPAAAHALLLLRRIRAGRYHGAPAAYWLAVASVGLPPLLLHAFEFEHPFLSAVCVLSIAGAVAYCLATLSRHRGWRLPELSARAAWVAVIGAFALYVGVIGFLSYWRVITFHAQPYDFSWEMNAVAGILRHGIPTISVGADSYYPTRALPAPYFDLHAPVIYYLYVPLYALAPDPRTLVWLQAAFMGSGVFGAFLVGRAWLGSRSLGVLVALAYALNPHIQGYALHDLHANVLAIPLLLLAVGFMEAGRARWAVAMTVLVSLCREETGLYAASVGLFWMLGGRGDRRRFRLGALTVLLSLGIFALMSAALMPAFGGKPRLRHFDLFFDKVNPLGFLKALVLNPVGVFNAATAPMRVEAALLALLPMGLLGLLGGRAAWFALPALPLLLTTSNPDFYAIGINYGAPISPPAILMSIMGMRVALLSNWLRSRWGQQRRLLLAAFVGVSVLWSNFLYGNILSKTYKLEYGGHPVRENQYRHKGTVGCLTRLPPLGTRERNLWAAIRRIPPDVPVATSWLLNPALSHRDVALVYPHLGQGNPPEDRPRYIILDKLPPMIEPTELHIEKLRADPAWVVDYENPHAVVFRRNP